MLSVRVMLLGVILIMISSLDFHGFGSLSVVARSIEKRAIPQLMDYDQSSYQQEQPPQREHRTHIVKIHSRKNQRSNDPVLGDVTNFQGIGDDHNAFGGPKYAGQYYPLMTEQGHQQRSSNFSFGNLLSGLALWNLANEFNMYSSQDPHQLVPNTRHNEPTKGHHHNHQQKNDSVESS
ncbi:unnamed protein product [Hermetia illucens]|uniref:Uncharacterized protein n=1 Tax=Hermetia illucens TaxID=343691 RepID=A0A7R8USE7_HERIL|nr:uncharacterized protein LOC119652821 [Hermetia illucens]CAD7086181.1 unnamed protein product [Hermetia illucens]